MAQLSFQYPEYYLFFCLALGIAGGFLLYFKSKSLQDRPEWQRFLLAVLRGICLFLLAFLLMNPIIKRFVNDLKKPQIAIAIDQSASMYQKDSNWIKDFTLSLDQLKKELSDKYQIDQYQFGSKTTKESISGAYSKRTDIDEAITTIADQSNPQLLKGVILVSDGIYNNGKNPYYNSLTQTTPFYTIFHGDSIQEKDLVIQRVYHNDIIYSGDKFATQVDLQAWFALDENLNFKLERLENNLWKTIFESKDKIDNKQFFTTKEIINEASSPGIYKYRAVCSSIQGERNLRNNTQYFFVEVLDARKKVLLFANGPHPDLSAIKNALESNKNYQVDIKYAFQTPDKLESYNLVIFHQLPSANYNIKPILTSLNLNRTARFFILGSATNLNEFNSSQDLVKIVGSGNSPNEAQALINPVFNNFTLSDGLSKNLPIYPPINAPFGNYETDPGASILLYQRIGKIDTKYPLFLFNDRSGIKTAALCGEGIWKWKFNEYLQSNNFDSFFELISKSIQYVSNKEDRRKFKAEANKKILSETEDLVINAELYNDNYERVNTPDVSLIVTSSDNKKYDYSIGKKENYYEINIGTLPPGDYSFIAKTSWNDKPLTSEGKFSIIQDDIELNNLVARPDLLRGLSEKSNGIAYQSNQLPELSKILMSEQNNKAILFQNLDISQFIDRKWLLYFVILLLTAEWFLRRFWGTY